ncbi:hypothetical protein COBT_003264, partial [Conglomerata obtusa]
MTDNSSKKRSQTDSENIKRQKTSDECIKGDEETSKVKKRLQTEVKNVKRYKTFEESIIGDEKTFENKICKKTTNSRVLYEPKAQIYQIIESQVITLELNQMENIVLETDVKLDDEKIKSCDNINNGIKDQQILIVTKKTSDITHENKHVFNFKESTCINVNKQNDDIDPVHEFHKTVINKKINEPQSSLEDIKSECQEKSLMNAQIIKNVDKETVDNIREGNNKFIINLVAMEEKLEGFEDDSKVTVNSIKISTFSKQNKEVFETNKITIKETENYTIRNEDISEHKKDDQPNTNRLTTTKNDCNLKNINNANNTTNLCDINDEVLQNNEMEKSMKNIKENETKVYTKNNDESKNVKENETKVYTKNNDESKDEIQNIKSLETTQKKFIEINKEILDNLINIADFKNYDTNLNLDDEKILANIELRTEKEDFLILIFNVYKTNKEKSNHIIINLRFFDNIDECIKNLIKINSIRLLKDLVAIKNTKLTNILFNNVENKKEWFKIISNIDFEFIEKNISNLITEEESKILFFKQIENKKIINYKAIINENIANQILNNMKIIDYEHFFKLQRFNEYEKITEKIEKCSMKFKFYLFEFIEINEDDCKTIKNLLKRLVERNIDIIYDKIFCYCMTNPFAVIESFIQNVIFSETLSKLLIKIISMMPKLFKEMFYYYMLKRFIAYEKIINGNSYDRTFISMCNLLSSFKTINPQPLMLLITKKLISKNYLYIPLIEKVMDDNTKISDKLKETLERAH